MRLLALLLPLALQAQSLTITGPAQVHGSFVVTVNSAFRFPSALKWSLQVPSGWTVTQPELRGAATNANKLITCDTTNTRCVVYGLNREVMATGQVARFRVVIPTTQPLGSARLLLTAVGASDAAGVAIAPSSLSVTVQ